MKPPEETMKWQRDVSVRYRADVAVMGGGIAGISAACAAAESGAKVILVERFAVTGGVANFATAITSPDRVKFLTGYLPVSRNGML